MMYPVFNSAIVDGLGKILPASWSEPSILSRSAVQWLTALCMVVLAFVLRKVFASLVILLLSKIRWLGGQLGRERFQKLKSTLSWILPAIGLRCALIYVLDLSGGQADSATSILLQIIFILIILLLFDTALQILFRWLEARNPLKMTEAVQQFYLQIIRIFLVILGLIMILSAFGLNVSGIVTGLGIGGLAVSLAAKDTLTNLFAGMTIISDHMFELGDLIQGPDFEGTVEYIGLRSSRLRGLDQTEFIVPNAWLANNVVINVSNMTKRRLRLLLTLPSYATLDQVDRLKDKLETYIRDRQGITEDPPLLVLESLANNNLSLMILYFLHDPDFGAFCQERDEVLRFVWNMLEEENLRLPRSQIQLLSDNAFLNSDTNTEQPPQ
ncbi:MAG: mechanosensitive ion channel family protein [Clostridiaceae bacterium]|jgi:MscS family membrane protein|nr:mechanosensitive ion channel family protein [Clostridiaceae bacterium]